MYVVPAKLAFLGLIHTSDIKVKGLYTVWNSIQFTSPKVRFQIPPEADLTPPLQCNISSRELRKGYTTTHKVGARP